MPIFEIFADIHYYPQFLNTIRLAFTYISKIQFSKLQANP